ncbi:uncharacterized protein LOC115571229 isoform X1 [Sparus aurata]|uniref:uncharacterized protein LOC115571229 isoform X1 n=1 Tax=Sparus aurata TaxID=8175 RepID=UPI0011C166B8|nr:uncharacterized protein LOC115571229 isoform X1 [Sparus aurata]
MPTPVQTRKLLKEYLSHLNDKRMEEFHWELWQIETDGSHPIPESKLPRNSTIEATVDKLVEAFGEDDAVERTVAALRAIKHNELASKLEQAKMDQSREQKADEPEISSATEKPRGVNPDLTKNISCFFAEHMQGVLSCSCDHKDWKSDIFWTEPANIRKKLKAFKTVKKWRNSSIEQIMTQSYFKEEQIMNDFKRRRALLHEEEETKRAALREETRQKIRATNWIADTTEDIFMVSEIKANRRFRANKRFTETLQVCTVFIISVLLAVGIGWTLTIFAPPATCVEARGKPSARSLGEDVEQHKKNGDEAK